MSDTAKPIGFTEKTAGILAKLRNYRLHDLIPLIRTKVRDAFYERAPDGTLIAGPMVKPSRIKSEGLHRVASAFHQNVDKLDSLALSVPLLMYVGRLMGKDEAGIMALDIGGLQPIASNAPPVKIPAREWESVEEHLEKNDELKKGIQATLGLVQMASFVLEQEAIDAWLASLIIGTWTAFETLAGDLWVSAVNSQPQVLAPLIGTEKRIERLAIGGVVNKPRPESKMEVDDEESCSASRTMIALGAMFRVTKGKYDLGDKMGTLLSTSRCVQFTSLDDIRAAYSLAFSEKAKKARTDNIDAALASKSLDALSAVRNLIVHKAGLADEVYLEDCRTAPNAPPLRDKERLMLNGAMCHDLIGPVIKVSVDLIIAVDSWLSNTRRG